MQMAGITLTQANDQLTAWLAANTAVAQGQSYQMGEERLTLADSDKILGQIKFWNGMVKSLGGSTRHPAFNIGLRGRDY